MKFKQRFATTFSRKLFPAMLLLSLGLSTFLFIVPQHSQAHAAVCWGPIKIGDCRSPEEKRLDELNRSAEEQRKRDENQRRHEEALRWFNDQADQEKARQEAAAQAAAALRPGDDKQNISCASKGKAACEATSYCRWYTGGSAASSLCLDKGKSSTPPQGAVKNPTQSGTSGGSSQQAPAQEPPPPPKDDLKCTQKQPVAGECQVSSTDGGVCKLKDAKDGKFEKGLCEVNPAQMCCIPIPPSVDLAVKPQDSASGSGVQTTVRPADVIIQDANKTPDEILKSTEAKLTYDEASGVFKKSQFSLGNLPKGEYEIIIRMKKYLDVLLINKDGTTTFTLGPGQKGESIPTELIAGDIAPAPKGDNYIDILDYNFLIACISPAPGGTCPDKKAADLNDDGNTDQLDLEILQKNFGKKGFASETFEFKCETDPACQSGQNNLQMCSLLCTKKSVRK